jgi:Uracil DNA glycosylase superfamily
MTKAPKYFENIVTCSEDCPWVSNCNTNSSLEPRFRPRGTTSRATLGNVRLMIILANPGKPSDLEDKEYSGKSSHAIAEVAWAFTEAVLEGKTVASPTLNKIIVEASYLLDCSPEQVLDQCVITNHVKCSTPEPYGSGKLALRKEISNRCIKRHLVTELEYWQPEKIAVFSATARDGLDNSGIHFDACISHPTARGNNLKPEVRKEKLRQVKTELDFH